MTMRAQLAAAGLRLSALMGQPLRYRLARTSAWVDFVGRLYVDESSLGFDAERGQESDASAAWLRVDASGPVLALGYQVEAADAQVWEVVSSQVRAMGGRYGLRRVAGRRAGPNGRGVV